MLKPGLGAVHIIFDDVYKYNAMKKKIEPKTISLYLSIISWSRQSIAQCFWVINSNHSVFQRWINGIFRQNITHDIWQNRPLNTKLFSPFFCLSLAIFPFLFSFAFHSFYLYVRWLLVSTLPEIDNGSVHSVCK